MQEQLPLVKPRNENYPGMLGAPPTTIPFHFESDVQNDIGSTAQNIGFLAADFEGDGTDRLIKFGNNNGRLSVTTFARASTGGFSRLTEQNDVGQGSENLGFFAPKLTSSGKALSLCQFWNHNGSLAIIVYSYSPQQGFVTRLANTTEASSTFLRCLFADVDGDGADELVHLAAKNGQLAPSVFKFNATSGFVKLWSGSVGQGSGNLGFFAMRKQKDEARRLVQMWDSGGGRLGVIVYKYTTNGLVTESVSRDLGLSNDGAFLSADVDGDEQDELLQLRNVAGRMEIAVFRFSDETLSLDKVSRNLGQGSDFTVAMTADLGGKGAAKLLQFWNNSGKLGVIVYEYEPAYGMRVVMTNGEISQSSARIGFVSGRFLDSAKVQAVQLRDVGGKLGANTYRAVAQGTRGGAMHTYSLLRLFPRQSVSFGVSFPLVFDSNFSIGFWIRLHSPGSPSAIFLKPDEFEILVDGFVPKIRIAQVGNVWAELTSPTPLSKGDWHYLTVSHDRSANNKVRLIIDGAVAIDRNVLQSAPNRRNDYVVGRELSADLLCLCFWNEVLELSESTCQWEVPPADPAMLACFCFSQGHAADMSPNRRPLNLVGAKQQWVSRALRLDGSGFVQPYSADSINPGARSNPFTIAAWIYVDEPDFETTDATAVVFCNGKFKTNSPNVTGYLSYDTALHHYRWTARRGADVVVDTAAIPPKTWRYVAVRYDASTLETFVDGTRGGRGPSNTSQAIEDHRFVVGASVDFAGVAPPASTFRGFIQIVSVWPTAIADEALKSSMWDEAGKDDRSAFFLFSNSTTNAVNGMPLALFGDARLEEQGMSLTHDDPTPSPLPVAPPKKRQAWPSVDRATFDKPIGDTLDDTEIQELVAEYRESFLVDLPESQREELEAQFTANLYQGLKDCESGAGRKRSPVVLKQVDEQLVLFFNQDGEQQVLLSSSEFAVDGACIVWVASIVSLCLIMILNLLGIGVTVRLLRDAIKGWVQVFPARWQALADLWRSGVTASTPIKVIRSVYTLGGLGLALQQALSGLSWWNWAFTIASTVLSVAAIWLTGGWYLAYFVAQLAINIAQLVLLVRERPNGCSF